MNFPSAKNVHIIGIGGIGISALAKWALEQGKQVTGFDLRPNLMTEWLQAHGVRVRTGEHDAKNVPQDCDLVLYSIAVPSTNPERQEADRRGLPCISYPQALNELLQTKQGIAIAGTHGKSTTTAMLAHILVAAGQDPSVIVGTRVRQFGDTNERIGKGPALLIEADEYNQGILLYHPLHAAILNVDREHVDLYPTLTDSQHAYQTFASNVSSKGTLTLNADDPSTPLLRQSTAARVCTFGFGHADLVGADVHVDSSGTTFQASGLYVGHVHLAVFGTHNVLNALAALCVAHALGVAFTTASQALHTFPGTWRRFERRGVWRGAVVIDDYAHHPTELAATLDTARQVFPGKRLLVVFQPHTHSRTIAFAEQFATVLRRADRVFVTDVYDVAGREAGLAADIPALVQSIGGNASAVHTVRDAVHALAPEVQANTVVLTIGAGDVTNFFDLAQKENPS